MEKEDKTELNDQLSSDNSLIKHKVKLKGHNQSVLCLDLNQEKQILASGGEDKSVRLWDYKSGNKAFKCMFKCFSSDVMSVCFIPGKDQIFAASSNKILGFDLRKPDIILTQCEKTYSFNEEEINQIVTSNEFLAACDDSGEVRIINLENGSLHKTLRKQHTTICSGIRFVPKRPSEIITGGLDGTILHWDITRPGKPLYKYNFAQTSANQTQVVNPPLVHSMDIAPDGIKVVAGLGNSSIALLDLRKKKIAQQDETTHSDTVSQVIFAPYEPSKYVISGSNDSRVIIWEITNEGFGLRPLSRVHHGSKVNWIACGIDKSIFVADQSEDITMYVQQT